MLYILTEKSKSYRETVKQYPKQWTQWILLVEIREASSIPLVKLTLYYWHITIYVGSTQFSYRKCHITFYLDDLVVHYYLHEGQFVENTDPVVLSGWSVTIAPPTKCHAHSMPSVDAY